MYRFNSGSPAESPDGLTGRTQEGASSPNATGQGFAIKPHALKNIGTLDDYTPQTKPDNRVMDTSHDKDEEQDVVANLQTDQSKEDFGAMLANRGFNEFNQPPARRATYQRGRAAPDERKRRASERGGDINTKTGLKFDKKPSF